MNREPLHVFFNGKSFVICDRKYGSSMCSEVVSHTYNGFFAKIHIKYTIKEELDVNFEGRGDFPFIEPPQINYPQFDPQKLQADFINSLTGKDGKHPVIFFIRDPLKKQISAVKQATQYASVSTSIVKYLKKHPSVDRVLRNSLEYYQGAQNIDINSPDDVNLKSPTSTKIWSRQTEEQNQYTESIYIELLAKAISSNWQEVLSDKHFTSDMCSSALRLLIHLESNFNIPQKLYIINLDELDSSQEGVELLYNLGWLKEPTNITHKDKSRNSNKTTTAAVNQALKELNPRVRFNFNHIVKIMNLNKDILQSKYGKYFR